MVAFLPLGLRRHSWILIFCAYIFPWLDFCFLSMKETSPISNVSELSLLTVRNISVFSCL